MLASGITATVKRLIKSGNVYILALSIITSSALAAYTTLVTTTHKPKANMYLLAQTGQKVALYDNGEFRPAVALTAGENIVVTITYIGAVN